MIFCFVIQGKNVSQNFLAEMVIHLKNPLLADLPLFQPSHLGIGFEQGDQIGRSFTYSNFR
jgi:hypothetical protein